MGFDGGTPFQLTETDTGYLIDLAAQDLAGSNIAHEGARH